MPSVERRVEAIAPNIEGEMDGDGDGGDDGRGGSVDSTMSGGGIHSI